MCHFVPGISGVSLYPSPCISAANIVAVALSVLNHPHIPALSVVAIAAGGVAIASTLLQQKRLAIAGSVVCCAGISTSLLFALSHH